ncbi:GNAT family N-acetyltransferase [Streptomyces sp. NPDC058307]|uniref:GNAT family N-acetyltransferase n=1 Tax=Streptomyces sp. NPDC058307 TaxID=3346439 RepID=UPI0036E40C2B
MTDLDDQHLIRPFTPLHGPGLRLCAWDADSDAQATDWLRAHDPEFGRWNTPLTLVHDLDGARAVMRHRAEQAAQGTSVSYRITDESSGTTLGHLGINMIDHVFRTARVGYWVLPEARGGVEG